MDKLFGLIGYPLSHSFSKKYFTEKFEKGHLVDHQYALFEISSIEEVRDIIDANPNLIGLNVTIPYKEVVLPYIDKFDSSAEKVGAVNVIRINGDVLTGYNSDYYGFEKSLLNWLPVDHQHIKALILGTGGASKAVKAVLESNKIDYRFISRTKTDITLTYEELYNTSLVADYKLIINTTPLGMSPNLGGCPDIPIDQITKDHFAYDLIYNPGQTNFLKKAKVAGAKIKNGLEMLELQAEKSWDIWTS